MAPRHSAVVRITHWIATISFFALLISGSAILISHPRLYWGEAGNIETPSLIDLPLPFVLVNQNGWGRYLHFLAAWISVLTGLVYASFGIVARHFGKHLLPAKADLAWRTVRHAALGHLRLRSPFPEEFLGYNVLQRIAYSAVVFVLFPFVVWTGLAMSPALTSVFPFLASLLGGQQSARTVHFFVSISLVLFLLVHVAMVCLTGFKSRMRGMITGRASVDKELA
jgi:thiosulfate reductase cytochrome b subunit